VSDRIFAVLTIAVAALFAALTQSFTVSLFADPLGPRFVPIAVSIFLAGAAVALFAKPTHEAAWPSGVKLVRLGVTLVVFIVYANALNPLGFIAATTLAFAAFAVLFYAPLLRAAVAGLVFSLVTYGLFSFLLDLYLPTGAWFEGLF
jgi:putative tricarboxylic transport membrane protein